MQKDKCLDRHFCEKDYFLGLDIGTNSVGYAVTDEEYNLIKFKGEPMWGTHVFEEGKQCAERRSYRTSRRRLDRRQQRVFLTQQIFAKEIEKVDPQFYIRLQESSLYAEDTTYGENGIFPKASEYSDRDYHRDYPTIHHLIVELMNNKHEHDVRLVYFAVAWLMAHRGHFLNEVSEDNVESVLDFNSVYERVTAVFRENELAVLWDAEPDTIKNILSKQLSVSRKEKMFIDEVYGGKKPKADADIDVVAVDSVIKLLCGGTVEASKLFIQKEFEEKISICFKKGEEEIQTVFAQIDDETGILERLKELYDWSLLYDIIGGDTVDDKDAGYKCISKNMVAKYNRHKEDLKNLKSFVKKYLPEKYYDIFKKADNNNYVAYSYNTKSCIDRTKVKNKITKEDFLDWLKKQIVVDRDSLAAEDKIFYDDMMERIGAYTFLPKQVDGENRVIPYQMYYYELKIILENASGYLAFLNECDDDGYSNKDKLLSILKFRIPYYVGPLHSSPNNIAWIKRKAAGSIRPWNFEEKVDLMASEDAFINRMTNTCTYIPGEKVLPKNSLLYCKYTVLNEINNIKINGQSIPVEYKQGIYRLFEQYRKVSKVKIEEYLRANNCLGSGDSLEGLDININSSLKSYHDFKKLLAEGILSEKEVEDIISRITYSEDKNRIRKWLDENYKTLSVNDRKYISNLKYKDFGRISEKLLTGITALNKQADEYVSVMHVMWEENLNLMQILFSEMYGFKERLENIKKEYYEEKPYTIETIMEELYISNAVKRPIYRTLDIINDVVKAAGRYPKRIFVEMARGKEEMPSRTKSRKEQLFELYKVCPESDVRELSKELEGKTDNELQSEVLYLYFMQLGRCMYSGDPIDIERLKLDTYVNVDHIYPQSFVKDDSLNNKALVFSEINGVKDNKYPISEDIRHKMSGFWHKLKENKLITEEKYKRLMRSTPFTGEEKLGFINRQLVETRQSTKAVAEILKNICPDTEIVYVKAGLAASFKQEYKIVKSRSINDLHHAKDAYLNIVCGNVHYCKFTINKRFSVDSEYSIKTKTVYGYPFRLGDKVIWKGTDDIERIKKILSKNNVHYTAYSFVRKGGLFDQQPLKAAENLVPRKKGLDTGKYGGYNKPSASYFLLISYTENGKKPKKELMLVPIELLAGEDIIAYETKAWNYVRKAIAQINGKSEEDVIDITFPLGLRRIKVNTILELDGVRCSVAKKTSRGSAIGINLCTPLIVSTFHEKYIKALESYDNKKKKNSAIELNEAYDGINADDNLSLYDCLSEKVTSGIFSCVLDSQKETLLDGRKEFVQLSLDKQVSVVLKLVELLKTGRSGTVDLSLIGGSKTAGAITIRSKLSNLKKRYTDVRIVDTSASGLFVSKSQNLLELL